MDLTLFLVKQRLFSIKTSINGTTEKVYFMGKAAAAVSKYWQGDAGEGKCN